MGPGTPWRPPASAVLVALRPLRDLSPPRAQLLLLPGKPGASRFQGLPTLSFQELNANLSNLTSAFEKATAEKIKCQQEADATNRVISLANRYLAPAPHHKTHPVLRPTTPKRDEPTERPLVG